MKYLLISYTDDGAVIENCVSTESRILKTCKAIYGDTIKASVKSFMEYEFCDLKSKGIVTFEGDPPVAWMDIPKGFSFDIVIKKD